MKVFVSYSFVDSELHLLTLLFEKLRQDGHTVESSDYYLTDEDEYKIRSSELFLGIITNNSDSINEVVQEWEIAKSNNVRSILIIEEGVKVEDDSIEHIRFNRSNSKPAIDSLFGTNKPNKKQDDYSDALLGAGILVGIAALIALLAGGGKK